jgi:hypothetical protein
MHCRANPASVQQKSPAETGGAFSLALGEPAPFALQGRSKFATQSVRVNLQKMV